MTLIYLSTVYRRDNFGAYINTQWETCQTTGAQCLLDASDPTNSTTMAPECQLGTVPGYFVSISVIVCSKVMFLTHWTQIDVRDATDVAAAFTFSEETGIPLVIKNTGVRIFRRSIGLLPNLIVARLQGSEQCPQFYSALGTYLAMPFLLGFSEAQF
jgi:hypothetical protein